MINFNEIIFTKPKQVEISLDNNGKIDDRINNIIENISNDFICRIKSPSIYLNTILESINNYLNKLKYDGILLNSTKIDKSILETDYGFEIYISIDYIVPYKFNYKTYNYTKIIKSDLNDMVDKSYLNLNKKLEELFKKYDN